MLKGIQHQMIEIATADSPYFERAFFVLLPDCADQNATHLQEEARRILLGAGGYSALYKNRRRNRLRRVLWALAGLLCGLLIGMLWAGR